MVIIGSLLGWARLGLIVAAIAEFTIGMVALKKRR